MSAFIFITILSYVFGFFYLLINLIKGLSNKFPKFQNALALILLFHLITVVDLLLVDNGLDLSLFKTFVLIAFIIILQTFTLLKFFFIQTSYMYAFDLCKVQIILTTKLVTYLSYTYKYSFCFIHKYNNVGEFKTYWTTSDINRS